MDHIDMILSIQDSIKNGYSYGNYRKISIMGIGYHESMSKLETFMQQGCSKEYALNMRLRIYGIVL